MTKRDIKGIDHEKLPLYLINEKDITQMFQSVNVEVIPYEIIWYTIITMCMFHYS